MDRERIEAIILKLDKTTILETDRYKFFYDVETEDWVINYGTFTVPSFTFWMVGGSIIEDVKSFLIKFERNEKIKNLLL